jgi:cell division protein FtsZ
VREEAHEDANIIFGSVIDESMGDTMRVTVIATGLTDPERIRRERPEMSTDNVTPLRPPLREEASPETLMNATLPAEMEPGVRPAGVREEEFMSPFNDELDVPAFIRRKNSQNEVV